MLKKRIIITLTFLDGVLNRTKKFRPDYRYTKNFIDLWSVDEILLIDISKKKFQKKFIEIIRFFSQNCYVPLSIGGGIRSIKDVDLYFKNGADKIILGNCTLGENILISEISKKYGNQSIIQSLDFKINDGIVSFYKDSGNKQILTDLDQAIRLINSSNIGEVLINSINKDGSLLGFDIPNFNLISKNISKPTLCLGGAGNWSHILDLFQKTTASAACTQNIFHFTEESINSLKNFLVNNDINIRK